VFGKEAPTVTVDTKEFLPPAPKGSGDEEAMGRRARPPRPPPRPELCCPCMRGRLARCAPPEQRPGRHAPLHAEAGMPETLRSCGSAARPARRSPRSAAPAAARPAAGRAERGRARARSSGGVVATSASGKIVCSNTLDDRLRIAYAQNLSSVRAMLFGITARA